MNSLIVEGFADFGPYCLHFPSTVGGICSSELKQRLQHTTGLPVDVQRLKFNSRYLQDSDEIPFGSSSSPSSTTVIHLTLSLNGGKGGFGANLKRLGGRMSRKGATNYEACRDLNGRRLRTLHDAQKLADYLEKEPEREKEKNERLMKKIKEGLEVEVEKRVIFNDTAYFERKEQMVEDVKDAVAKVMANGGPIKDSIIGAETEPSRKSATLSGVQPQNADPLGLWNDLSSSSDESDHHEDGSNSGPSKATASATKRKRKSAA